MYNFNLVNLDTDSITVCKSDGTPFSEEEQENLLKELNSLYPDKINWESDGTFDKVIVIKAKNYILYNEGKIKYKGSAITDQKKEPALIEMLHRMIGVLLEIDTENTIESIYNEYIIESQNIQDIKRWSTKKTITSAVFNSERTNESKVRDCLEGENVQQGDKIWVYPAIDGVKEELTKTGKTKTSPNRVLKLIKNWNSDEDKEHFLKRVHSTTMILKNIIDTEILIKYHIKKNKNLLDGILND